MKLSLMHMRYLALLVSTPLLTCAMLPVKEGSSNREITATTLLIPAPQPIKAKEWVKGANGKWEPKELATESTPVSHEDLTQDHMTATVVLKEKYSKEKKVIADILEQRKKLEQQEVQERQKEQELKQLLITRIAASQAAEWGSNYTREITKQEIDALIAKKQAVVEACEKERSALEQKTAELKAALAETEKALVAKPEASEHTSTAQASTILPAASVTQDKEVKPAAKSSTKKGWLW